MLRQRGGLLRRRIETKPGHAAILAVQAANSGIIGVVSRASFLP
jgi:hypothetical protein